MRAMAAATDNLLRPILIVEDNDDDLVMLQHLLRRTRIANPTIVARNGTEAIELLRQIEEANVIGGEPHIVLTDLKMPGVTGIELAAWIRKRPRFAGLRVVMLSCSNLPGDVDRARAAGVDTFFLKYPTAKELSGVLSH